MKKADRPPVVLVIGNNNKISFGGRGSLPSAIVVASVVITVAVLAAAFCCPDQLTNLVRFIVGTLINN